MDKQSAFFVLWDRLLVVEGLTCCDPSHQPSSLRRAAGRKSAWGVGKPVNGLNQIAVAAEPAVKRLACGKPSPLKRAQGMAADCLTGPRTGGDQSHLIHPGPRLQPRVNPHHEKSPGKGDTTIPPPHPPQKCTISQIPKIIHSRINSKYSLFKSNTSTTATPNHPPFHLVA